MPEDDIDHPVADSGHWRPVVVRGQDLSLFHELNDRGRHERLRDRRHVEEALGDERLAGLEVPHAQSPQIDDLPSPHDRDREPGNPMDRHRLREEVVEPFLEARGRGSFGAARQKEQENESRLIGVVYRPESVLSQDQRAKTRDLSRLCAVVSTQILRNKGGERLVRSLHAFLMGGGGSWTGSRCSVKP